MADNRLLDDKTIGDIILCEPVTRRGREALSNLGLTLQEVTPGFFYSDLRVESRFDAEKEYENKVYGNTNEENGMYYQYTVDAIQFGLLKDRLKNFNSRFNSDAPSSYPLLMLGVAGNGKSIEINRRIRNIAPGESEFVCGRMYFDLEEAFTEITYGASYFCPSNTPLWLFCIKLLDGIMRYIQQCHLLCHEIWNNFNSILVSKNLADKEQRKLFEIIGNYCIDDQDNETELFETLISFLNGQQADRDIRTLLKIAMWIMFCTDPNKKHYIIFDNIEQYIRLNAAKIQIPDSDISRLYRSINDVVMNTVNDFNRIEKDLGWKVFKIIFVIRRTSIGLLDSAFLHSPVRGGENITDVTGHYYVPDIWKQKKQYIWEPMLRERFHDERNKCIVDIIDRIMKDGTQAVGMDYQSLIAPLMSYGIRRNARSQAHAAYRTYELLTNGDQANINLNTFNTLLDNASADNSAGRYMFRRALIEFQFKWAFSNGDQDRWEKLGIGHLAGQKGRRYSGRNLVIESVEYSDPKCVTLLRRILTYLAYFPDRVSAPVKTQGKSVVDMCATVSLYDLVEGVLLNPAQDEITQENFLQFAKVLIGLSDMSNEDTRSAPYIILGIKDENFHLNPYASVLAEILSTIRKAGKEKSLPGDQYDCSDYGVRITDAGNAFLLDWQASFSFMASLHCFTIPPLFFLKDAVSIKYVIETVYNASFDLCKKYEEEANRFAGGDFTLKSDAFRYLPKHKGRHITFKQRVRELHSNHLHLYIDFLEKNYRDIPISERSKDDLTAYIRKYIDMYNSWKTSEGAPECF